jgi:hypothetical protein
MSIQVSQYLIVNTSQEKGKTEIGRCRWDALMLQNAIVFMRHVKTPSTVCTAVATGV